MEPIRVAVIGVGNCFSALLQGIHYYRHKQPDEVIGLMHWNLGGYTPGDIEIVAAVDVDRRKVGRDVAEAVFQPPNCTARFYEDIPKSGVMVQMGRILDGVAPHMKNYPESRRFEPADDPEADEERIVDLFRSRGVQVVMNYLPVGAEEAVKFYVSCILKAGAAMVNNMPVFIASNPEWAQRFATAGVPIIGDDIKSQLGATITHRVLAGLFRDRGVQLEHTYQLNTGGNTDFLNMLDRSRLKSKRESKTEAVQSMLTDRLEDEDIHIGPSDYIAWLNDRKLCFLRMEGRIFGDIPIDMEIRLSVEDSPNSAGVGIDAIRCCRLALDRGAAGVLESPSAYFMKHPPIQYADHEARAMVEAFIRGERER